ncbi:MAG TPA: hypothetical protein PKI99_04845, partial [Terrimesophilobacter sp.]|nr:hypothetical protein [Terrimesophilobacter sp.]
EQGLLPGLGTGQGLWRIKDRSFVVQHQLHPAELAAFDTTSRMTGIPREFNSSEAGSHGDSRVVPVSGYLST